MHNLRCALDHLVYPLALSHKDGDLTPQQARLLQLPIVDALAHPRAHIPLRWLVVAEAQEDDAIECRTGLAITSTIESMVVGLTRRGRNRVHSA